VLEERQARMLEDPGLLGKARARVEAAHRLSPADLPIALELSRFRQETGDGPGAEEILLAARRLAPNDLRLEARLADVYLRQGRSAEAARALWRARSVNQSLARSLGQLTAALELTQADRGIGLLSDWADDDLREALRVANETAVRLHAARQPEAQGRVLGLIVELDPSDTCAAVSLAEQALRSGQRDRARTMLARIVASAPGPGDKNARCHRLAIENFVALELADRRYAEVDGLLRNQIQERPWEGWLRVLLSDVQVARKDPAAAKETLQQGLRRRSTDVDLLVRLGQLYESQGASETALRYYRDALRADPKNPRIQALVRRLENLDRT